MKLYNTLTGKKEKLRKPLRRPVKMFVCGPTVYDHPHIGNLRTYTAFDLMVRYIRSRGYDLFYLQNITDIDDKIIARAGERQTTWDKIAREYEAIYMQNLKDLNITAVTKFARATDHIEQIVHQVKTLIKKGNAYKIENDPSRPGGAGAGGWYFDLTTFSDYGKLSHRTSQETGDEVSRIDESVAKRNPGDFCLWKFSKPGEPSWSTELGTGRPGWHIEDTAITEYFFGPQYDLHGGGLYLKFPHHEAEIAQQEAASGKKPFVKIWMHTGMLDISGAKMSKSLGNFVTIADFLKHYSSDTFRMLVLSHHYRSPMNYTESLAETAKKNITAFSAFLKKLTILDGVNAKGATFRVKEFSAQFHEAMEDDFNTPKGLAVLFDLMNTANQDIWTLTVKEAQELHAFLTETLTMLGFSNLELKIPNDVIRLVERRELFRRSKQFIQSDDLRKQIETLGYVVEDTRKGALVLPK